MKKLHPKYRSPHSIHESMTDENLGDEVDDDIVHAGDGQTRRTNRDSGEKFVGGANMLLFRQSSSAMICRTRNPLFPPTPR